MASGFILLFAEYLSERRAFVHMYIYKYYTEYVSIKCINTISNNNNGSNDNIYIYNYKYLSILYIPQRCIYIYACVCMRTFPPDSRPVLLPASIIYLSA